MITFWQHLIKEADENIRIMRWNEVKTDGDLVWKIAKLHYDAFLSSEDKKGKRFEDSRDEILGENLKGWVGLDEDNNIIGYMFYYPESYFKQEQTGSYIAALNANKNQSPLMVRAFLKKMKDHIQIIPHPIYLKVLPGETERVLQRLYRHAGFKEIENPNPDDRAILMRKV